MFKFEIRILLHKLIIKDILRLLMATLLTHKMGQTLATQNYFICSYKKFLDRNYRLYFIHQVTLIRKQRRDLSVFVSSSQAATCQPVKHTRRKLHTVSLIAERQAGKL